VSGSDNRDDGGVALHSVNAIAPARELQVVTAPAPPAELTVDEVLAQIEKIQAVMQKAMKPDQHYGIIPGTGDKPALLQPGAQKLSLLFQLSPRYRINREDHAGGHRTYELVCELHHAQRGFVGEGVGLCSTLESKYRWRAGYEDTGEPIPDDSKERKAEYRKAGFGMRKIEERWCWVRYTDGREENPDIADTYNTVLKMGKKRSFVDAILQTTAASDIFTQDLVERASEADPEPPAASWWKGDSGAFHVVHEIGQLAKRLDREQNARDFLREQGRQAGEREVLLGYLLDYRNNLQNDLIVADEAPEDQHGHDGPGGAQDAESDLELTGQTDAEAQAETKTQVDEQDGAGFDDDAIPF